MRAPVSVAVVGLGDRGLRLARALDELPGVQLAWICDENPERLMLVRGRYAAARATTDIDTVLADESVDAVIVATSLASRHEIGTRALCAGKHLLLEGPIASRGLQADEMLHRAEAGGLVVVPGHYRLFDGAIARMKEAVERGQVGEIAHVYATDRRPAARNDDWGPLRSIGADLAAVVLHIVGDEPVEASARGEAVDVPGHRDIVYADLGFATGITAHLNVSCVEPVPAHEILVVGSKRTIRYDAHARDRTLTIFDRAEGPPRAQGDRRTGVGRMVAPSLEEGDPVRLACEYFEMCVRNRADRLLLGPTAALTVNLVEALQRSLGERGKVVTDRRGAPGRLVPLPARP